jgi:hypothetical protein
MFFKPLFWTPSLNSLSLVQIIPTRLAVSVIFNCACSSNFHSGWLHERERNYMHQINDGEPRTTDSGFFPRLPLYRASLNRHDLCRGSSKQPTRDFHQRVGVHCEASVLRRGAPHKTKSDWGLHRSLTTIATHRGLLVVKQGESARERDSNLCPS